MSSVLARRRSRAATKTDLYGDPLPGGALMRRGTICNCAPITGFGIAKSRKERDPDKAVAVVEEDFEPATDFCEYDRVLTGAPQSL